MLDLCKKKYDLKTLKHNIYAVSLLDILKTQTIDAKFAVHYILNNIYQLSKEESKITLNDVLHYQPHIKKYEIDNEILIFDSGVDSLEDFETCMLKN